MTFTQVGMSCTEQDRKHHSGAQTSPLSTGMCCCCPSGSLPRFAAPRSALWVCGATKHLQTSPQNHLDTSDCADKSNCCCSRCFRQNCFTSACRGHLWRKALLPLHSNSSPRMGMFDMELVGSRKKCITPRSPPVQQLLNQTPIFSSARQSGCCAQNTSP